ncbi:Uncharacterised protein [Mycobacterium tuberculosis]|uniref:Uncharacterized protein n=1 Tax=Mycobacterium tuberculosis TaxID=1773 RepID=A0A654U8U6_MYCTX|nr:Uncharacterised protein [Mycobacterium tuberculosis]
MFGGRVIVAGEQLGDGPVPDQSPSPANAFGQIVEFSGGLGHIAEIQQRADFH